jgi:protein-disulfide isomerase
MFAKLSRIGLLTGLAAVIACGGAPTTPAGQAGAGTQTAQGTPAKDAPKSPMVVIGGEGAEADKGGVPGARRSGGGEMVDGDSTGAPSGGPSMARGFADAKDIDTGEGKKSPVPVTAADPSWGSPNALVTIVEFSDLECPFCARAADTVSQLVRTYKPEELRVVWKNYPLPFHKRARPAAETAMALYKLGGAKSFWAYHDAFFTGIRTFTAPEDVDKALPSGYSRPMIDAELAKGDAARKVDEDMDLGKKIGVTGTPAFFINGVFLSGAQPIDKFRAIIDAELVATRKDVANGTPAGKIYAARSTANYQKPADPPAGSAPADDKTVWRVPVDKSPVRGKNTALVTLVMFADYQCPFCVRVEPTVEQLAQKYGDKLRIVFKHNPLPFHNRAEPAAELAIEARAQKGDAAFWKVHELLWAQNGKLEDADLEAVAKNAGIDPKKAMAAVAAHKHKAVIEADEDLADDVQASGTPHFFINGRRLVGAQPIEKFTAVIDEELAKAEELVKKGTPAAKVYDTLQKDAKTAEPPKKVQIPAPTADNPSRGPAKAKVVIQEFADFQCPFCKRVDGTLHELEAAFPGQIRLVWRNKPLPFHKEAEPAAEAAMEAFKEKGNDGFWKMHDLLFADQSKLSRPDLEGYAAQLKLDPAKFAAALDGHTYQAQIDADSKIADAAGITGTPSFVINGYLLVGAQPLGKFKRVVNLALREAK